MRSSIIFSIILAISSASFTIADVTNSVDAAAVTITKTLTKQTTKTTTITVTSPSNCTSTTAPNPPSNDLGYSTFGPGNCNIRINFETPKPWKIHRNTDLPTGKIEFLRTNAARSGKQVLFSSWDSPVLDQRSPGFASLKIKVCQGKKYMFKAYINRPWGGGHPEFFLGNQMVAMGDNAPEIPNAWLVRNGVWVVPKGGDEVEFKVAFMRSLIGRPIDDIRPNPEIMVDDVSLTVME
ncbi:hypothetical protein BZA77DRAFT_321062 [Pyronema omphalodes]|nr:hypothetical protein BZA77DRAFT_321062 [Pyronema omphalodes]